MVKKKNGGVFTSAFLHHNSLCEKCKLECLPVTVYFPFPLRSGGTTKGYLLADTNALAYFVSKSDTKK